MTRFRPRSISAGYALFAAAVVAVLVAALIAVFASAPSSGAQTPPRAAMVAQHHAARVHALRLHHAALVRARDRQRAQWVRDWTPVAICEEGGWIGYAGPAFPDSLGIMASAWYGHGGGSDLRPFVQAKVGMRLLDSLGLHGWLPDRGACAAW